MSWPILEVESISGKSPNTATKDFFYAELILVDLLANGGVSATHSAGKGSASNSACCLEVDLRTLNVQTRWYKNT